MMEFEKELSRVFDINQKESLKYRIQNFDNIKNFLEIFQKNEEIKKYPLNLESITNIISFLKLSFLTFRSNISYFNKYSNYKIYEILIDFYLSNDYSSNDLDDVCLNLIDILINNIDISKSIIDSVIQKISKFFYSLEEPNPKYEYLLKLLKILNHLYGINLNIKKPKHYYYFSGMEKYEKNYISVPLEEPNQTMAITLWFKAYDNKNGDIIYLGNNKGNNVFKINIEENKLNLIYGEKSNSLKKSEFYTHDYNNISFYYKPSKKKINVSLYINEKQILKDHSINDIEENNPVTNLFIGKNFFGEITSIILTKNIINYDEYKKLSLNFPFGLVTEKDIINFSKDFSKIASMIKSIYIPYGGKYNLYNNQSKDLFFGDYTGFNYYISFQKKINLLGGINIILPIIELLYLNMKLCIKHKDLLFLFFELILTIIKYKKKNMDNAINQKFFMILSIFIEKMPKDLFDNKIHQIIMDLAKNIFFYHNTCSLYLDYCEYVLLNEKIVFKFIASEQVKFWEQIYKYYEQSEKFSLPLNKLVSIITYNDSKYASREEICCKNHHDCYLEEYNPTISKIMKPDFNSKTENIFLLFKSIVLSDKNKSKNYKEMANMLTFNTSPCLTLKILEFIIEQFSKKKSDNKEEEKENKKLKETIFSLYNNEEYKKILFNLLFSEFLDIKYITINFIFMLYEYDKKKFNFSFKFLKENIFPRNITDNFRYMNFSPLPQDTSSLAEHCTNKILKKDSINCFEHDNIICSSIFNFSYLSIYYTKIINLFIDFINNNSEKYEEVLDLSLYLCKNLNIEITESLFIKISSLSSSNENLLKKIFSFIPFLNYILETIIYYSEYKNNVFQFTYNFLINRIISIEDNKTKIFIIEYMIKYFSLIRNKDSKHTNLNLNNVIRRILTKFLLQLSDEYLNIQMYEKNNQFIIELTSKLFDYITIFNQDSKLYKMCQTNNITNYILSTYTGVSIICTFIPGLNIIEYEKDLKNPKLEKQWWDYEIVLKILSLFEKEFNLSELYIKDKEIKNQTDKGLYIYDNLIYKDDINDKNLFKKKDLLYYVKDKSKDIPLIKIISYLYMLCLNMCKDENEYKKLLSQFIEFLEFIIVISTKLYSISQSEQNKKEINYYTITFSLMFLFDAITQPNEFLLKNNNIKELMISHFNEILSICLYVYIQRIPEVKTGIIKGMFKKMKSKIQKHLPLNMTPPYEIIYEFFIKDEIKEEEEKNILLIKNNEKNFNQFYTIITGSDKILNNFNINCQKYMSKHFAAYINFDLIINLSKSRLKENTTNETFVPKEEKYSINFDKIKTDIGPIITKVKMSSSDYINYSYQTQRAKRNEYKSLKKELFIWNGPWSNKELFYKNKNRIKYKLYNHLTKSLLRPFLIPLLDLEYYTPIFTHFQIEKIFNKNDISIHKYKDLCLDIDKILNSNENKTEDYQFIDNSNEEELLQAKKYECCFVKSTHHIKGIFLCSDKGIQFKVFLNQKTLTNDINDTDTSRQEQDIDYDNIRHTCYGSYFVEHPKIKDNLYFNFSFEQIKYIFKRIYYYHQTGLEIYTMNNKSHYFNFKNASVRNKIHDEISSHLQKYKISLDNIITKWKKYEISNMEFLMWLNIFGGRSYNDLSQYPVIPWVIGDYARKELKEKDINSDKTLYRDLSLPLGMITNNDKGERKEGYIYNLKSTTKIKSDKPKNESPETDLFEKPYNYGTHYSNPFYVAHFLTRIYPFSYIMIELQGNKFDDPDRLFISMNISYLGATTKKGDVRELIPEIYSLPEIYHNINNFDLGIRRNKTKVNDVECPVWSGNDPYKLVAYLNLAFESNFVSTTLGGWIDLVFGFKQRGKEALLNNNVYMFNSYPDLVDIENMSIDKKRYYYRFVEFGSCPKQLFKKPFDNKESYSGFKPITDNSVSVITIELKNKNMQQIEKKEEKTENEIQEETEDDIIEQIKQKKNVKQFFPLPKKGAKLLYSNYTGIHLSQKKLNEDTYSYEQNLFLYGYGIKFEKYFIGNNHIMDESPSVMFGKGRYLLEGGYLDGLMMLSDFEENKSEKLYNLNDKSPVTSIIMNKDENLAIVANIIGIIYVYDVNKKKFEFKKKIQYHSKAINYLFISDELNAFASCSKDNYVNIYSLPSCSLVHSLEVEEPELVLLSGRPLPIFIIYSKKLKKLLIFGVNGHFIGEMDMENKPQYSFIYTSKSFRDYLIYSNRGMITIRALPYLEIFKTLNLNGEKNLPINNLYLQYQNNINESERLYVLDQSKQTLYIIGDSASY